VDIYSKKAWKLLYSVNKPIYKRINLFTKVDWTSKRRRYKFSTIQEKFRFFTKCRSILNSISMTTKSTFRIILLTRTQISAITWMIKRLDARIKIFWIENNCVRHSLGTDCNSSLSRISVSVRKIWRKGEVLSLLRVSILVRLVIYFYLIKTSFFMDYERIPGLYTWW
jgi:hypothetical protein